MIRLALALLPAAALAYYVPDFTKPWMKRSDPPAVRARILLGQMNFTQVTHLMHGSNTPPYEGGRYVGLVKGDTTLNTPDIRLNDGPQGFRVTNQSFEGTSTAWPSGLTVGATFDVEMASKWGIAMGEEFLGKGANVQLGPGLCLARVPQCGRNFEYISGEDPWLGYIMVQPVIKGIQSMGVVANAKHYINNNQETDRHTDSADLDERTEFEMYITPFQGAVAAGVGSIMCSYNLINGTWSCENPVTLQLDFKERSNFTGWVMSDWGATHSTSINAGLDQEMPGDGYMNEQNLASMVQKGTVTMATINATALRILTPLFQMGVFDRPQSNTTFMNVTSPEHNAVARELAGASTVLLKNDGGLLPIDKTQTKKIALIGSDAAAPVVHGGGSGSVVPSYVVDPMSAIRAEMGLPAPSTPPSNCSEANWVKGVDYRNTDSQTSASAKSVADCCTLCAQRSGPVPCSVFTFTSDGTCWMKADDANPVQDPQVTSGFARPVVPTDACSKDGSVCVYYDDGSNISSAQATAAKADIAIVFASTTSSEGSDRGSLSLDGNADDLIAGVAQAQPKTAVAMVQPGAVLTPWRDSVKTLLASFMPGQEYGNALTDVLFGKVNPSGRLPLTFPANMSQIAMSKEQWPGVNNPPVSTYSEKLLVGYRSFDAKGYEPAYPFGHGLSYTTFHYSSIYVSRGSVSFTVANNGTVAGKEIVQLYLGFPSAAGEPPKQLKRFQAVNLQPGQSQGVTFDLTDRDLSIWDISTHSWAVQSGTFTAYVGASSRDIRLQDGFTV